MAGSSIWLEQSPLSFDSAYSLAHVDDLLGILMSQSNRSKQSLESYRSAVSILERLRQASPENSRVPMLLSSTLTNLAIELRLDQPEQVFGQARDLRGQDRLEEAREAGAESVSLLDRLVADSPQYHNLASRLADALARLSTVEQRLDEFGQALELRGHRTRLR